MSHPLHIVFVGLSLSSSWGNGHATTYRALLRGLKAAGHSATFLERDVPWYASNRDLPAPDFCTLAYYTSVSDLHSRFAAEIETADAVIIGSYVPDGVAVIDMITALDTGPMCFYDIDTPVTLGRLARGDEDYLSARQIPLFDIYYSFSGGPVLERLERQYGAQRAEALYCAVDASRYGPTGAEKRWDLGYLGTYSDDRQPVLEKLLIEPARRLPEKRFVVAGPQYPDTIDWPDNVERIEHLPPAEHAAFYSRQRQTLNVTRADMVAAGWSPSVRLFEAAACGTPIISDFWEGLTELFPADAAIIIARSSEDVIAALCAPEDDRAARAEAARNIVLKAHTGDARARQLAASLIEAAQTPTRRQAASA